MADEFTIRLQGLEAVQRALFQINTRLGERVNRLAVRKGANYMLKQIRASTPISRTGTSEKSGDGQRVHFPPGRLKRAEKVKVSKIHTLRKNQTIGLYFTVAKGKKRNDPKGAWYAKFVENKQGFIRNTFNREAITSQELIVRASEEALRHVAQSLNLNISG